MVYRAAVLACITFGVAACGGGSQTSHTTRSTLTVRDQTTSSGPTASGASVAQPAASAAQPAAPSPPARPRPRKPPPPTYPRLRAAALGTGSTRFIPVVSWRGGPAVWISRVDSAVALLSFDQRLLELRLHSGTLDAGTAGWRFGPSVAGLERRRLVAAFNGGFRLSVGAGGFESYGHVAVPLRDGVGSIVTYADGTTDVGPWRSGVPRPGPPVVSVRQNLPLLIAHGSAAGTLDCLTCWGATLGGVADPARSALGVTAGGKLIWAGGEHLTVSQLADALLGAHVVRAVELDINPEWVAGYLYGHRGGSGPLAPIPVVPGQVGIPGQFLAPWSRDFFTVVAR